MSELSFLHTDSYNETDLQSAVQRHFELLNIQIAPDARVVIKPNLIMRCGPERAATTHPAIVEAVVRQLQAMGVRDITIADSPGGLYTPQLLAAAYAATGMETVAKQYGVKLNTAVGSRELRGADAALCRTFDIIDPVADADCVINLCKLKTHCMTMLSCGVKNLFGCIPGLLKPQLHYRFPDTDAFARMLIDLSLLVRPALTIVDAVMAMEGNGPTGGRARPLGFTAAARFDGLYALDLVMAHLIGLTPRYVPTVADAIGRGLCPCDWSQAVVLGDTLPPPFDDFLPPDSKRLDFTNNIPAPLAVLVRRIQPKLAPRPHVRPRDCVGCGRCAESCPAKTIQIKNKKAKINLSNCIHCFCCQEMCPVRAIDVHTVKLFHLFSKSR